MMRFGNAAGPHKPPFPLAAMIDILFLLLLFFMLTSLYASREAELNITLPVSKEASEVERPKQDIVINIKADGTYVINQITYSTDEVNEILRVLSEVPYEGEHVIVRGDKEAKYDYVIKLLDLCKRYNIWNVSFAVSKEEPASAAP
jgi:biopolymer transport protein ExbD